MRSILGIAGCAVAAGCASSTARPDAAATSAGAGGGRRAPASEVAPGEWAAYGRDALGSRWSPLRDLTPSTVGRLAPAWTYHTGETEARWQTAKRTSLETTPLVVDGTMYVSTPLGRVIALDPTTGRQRWQFDPGVDRRIAYGDFTNRGVSTWVDPLAAGGDACRRLIYVATIDGRLIAIGAADGRPCAGFGRGGTVSLRSGLRNGPAFDDEYEVTSPPAVVNGLLVVGSAVADNNRTDAASGEVRGYDARTGALRWTWDPVPQDPADPAYASWEGEVAHRTGAANAWSVLAADPERDLVFVPTSSPSPDYWGGARPGRNDYANSVVALRASTGKVVWHFQTVHHDLWDYDNASPPALVTLRRGGREIPAVIQATKSGMLFVLHRETGTPLFPVEERRVPASTVAGERAWPTQPFSSLPAFGLRDFSPDSAFGLTDADRAACRDAVAGLRNEGSFTPPSREGTLVVPSNVGGAHWGGVVFDPERQIVVLPVNRLAAIVQLIPADSLDRTALHVRDSRLGFEYTRMRGTPYVMRRRILIGPSRVPCTPPPFGALVAVSLATGDKLWEVPLGTLPGAPALSPEPRPGSNEGALGSPNLGGPIATAGGLVFVAATIDQRLRAFDIESGRELWSAALPAGGKATPMTYRGGDGRQYVVVAAGGDGGDVFGRGDAIVAFALPPGAAPR
jgi:quinoprotein glucose dehydrogenase